MSEPRRLTDAKDERIFAILLRAYPAGFRARYGREMTTVFRDLRREGRGGWGWWRDLVLDVLRSAPRQRLEGLTSSTWEAGMMTIAILSILVGAVEAAGALVELVAVIRNPVGGGPATPGSALGVAAGALLLGAGMALLRRSPGAVTLARAAAVTSVLVTVLISYVIPMMGYFAQILGIGFPLVLLFYLRRTGSGSLTPNTGRA
jgi:hypothetical protein